MEPKLDIVKSVTKSLVNMNDLQIQYVEKIRPELKKELSIGNDLATPRMDKVVINVGFGKFQEDKAVKDLIVDSLRRVTGQQPEMTRAKKAISNFKVREGAEIGARVTLRGPRMYDFVQKLIRISFPRVRDFRGIKVKNIDQFGNLNVGLKEHNVFPEISLDDVERLFGLQVTVVTTAENAKQGEMLLRKLGFPLQKPNQDK